MKVKSLTNVTFVTKAFFLNNDLNPNFSSVYEGKIPYKCHICVKSFFLNNDSNPNIADIHEGKSLINGTFVTKIFF